MSVFSSSISQVPSIVPGIQKTLYKYLLNERRKKKIKNGSKYNCSFKKKKRRREGKGKMSASLVRFKIF